MSNSSQGAVSAGFGCDLCAQRFPLDKLLLMHRQRVHFAGIAYDLQDKSAVTVLQSAEGQWNCPWCACTFTEVDDLTDHLSHHVAIISHKRLPPPPLRVLKSRTSPSSSPPRVQPYPSPGGRWLASQTSSRGSARPGLSDPSVCAPESRELGSATSVPVLQPGPPATPSDDAESRPPTPSALNTVDNPVLAKCGFIIDTTHHALICRLCKGCIWSSGAWIHTHKVHKGNKLTAEEITVLEALFKTYKVHCMPTDYSFPWGTADIDGLELTPQGQICRPCKYACPLRSSMLIHLRSAKHRATTTTGIQDIEIGPIQAFFPRSHRTYFLVHPASKGLGPRNPYVLYLEQYADQLTLPMDTLPEPIAAGEVPQLERLTYWGSHLSPWTGTRTEVSRLCELIDTRSVVGTRLEPLRLTCLEYLQRVKEIGQRSHLNVRSNLRECPKGDKGPWRVLGDPRTLGDYSGILLRLCLGTIRSALGSMQTTYVLPISPAHKARIFAYVQTLSSPTIDLNAFHAILPPLFMVDKDNPMDPVQSKFEHALECLIAIANLRPDGTFQQPGAVTPFLAAVKYLIRAAIIFEGHTIATLENISLEAAVYPLCVQNINRSSSSPFNSVVDLQAFVTSLARRAVAPPVTRVSPDGMNITYKEITLSVTQQRIGLRLALSDVELMIDRLCFSFPLKPDIPEQPKDDWGENRRGYSFVNNHMYIPPDSFFCHLLQSSEAGLTATSADNQLTFVQPAVDRLMIQDATLQKTLAPLVFSSSSFARPAEFVDTKIKNSTRPRNVFMHGKDLWVVTRRMKWENLVGYEVFVPLLISPPVVPLLLFYLLVFRPALVRLLRITKGETVARLYDEYMWVANGQQISSQLFSFYLGEFTETYFHVHMTSQPHRHIQVEEFRIFLNSTADLAVDEHDVPSGVRGHSTSTATRVYSVEEGYLSTLSSDLLLQHRSFCLSWAEVLGLRPGFPPLMPILQRQRLREHEGGPSTPLEPSSAPFSAPALGIDVVAVIMDTLQQLGIRQEANIRRSVAQGFVEVLSRHQLRLPIQEEPSQSPFQEILLTDRNLFEPAPEVPMEDSTGDWMQQALRLLRLFYGDDSAEFRSAQQHEAVSAALECNINFCACLPTAGGKSLVYMLPAFFEEGRLTIVMCPNAALLRDQLARSEELGLTCATWTVEDSTVSRDVQLAYVALESAVTDTFLGFVSAPESAVRRLVFDEIHQALTESEYRQDFLKLLKLAPVGIQKIWLSGTLTGPLMGHLWSLLHQPRATRVIRAPVLHANIEFHRVVVQGGAKTTSFVVHLVRLLESVEMKGEEEGLIFFRTKAQVIAFSTHARSMAISIVPSHADLPHRVTNEQQWMRGKSKWIAATGTLIHGVDNARCKVVMFVGWDAGLLLFAQGWGRAGRNGQRALAFLVGPRVSPQPADRINDPDLHCFQQSAEFFRNTTDCRRLVLGLAFNGQARSCSQIRDAQECDICDPLGELTVQIRALLQNIDPSPPAPAAPATTAADMPSVPVFRPDEPSMSILLDAEGAAALQLRKRQVHSQFTLLVSTISDKCAACWGSTGQLSPRHAGAPVSCAGEHDGLNWDQFKAWSKLIRLPKAHCYKCGLPNGQGFTQQGHPWLGCDSRFEDLHQNALYMIRRTPAVWEPVLLSFPHKETLTADMSDEQYAQWINACPRSFYNGLELLVWVWMARDVRMRSAVE